MNVRVRVLEVGGRHDRVTNARSSWGGRTGFLLMIDAEGVVAVGEASPLPQGALDSSLADSPETAREALSGSSMKAALEASLAVSATPKERDSIERWLEPLQSIASPSARFAAETAMLDMLGQRHGLPVAELLAAATKIPDTLSTSEVIDPLDPAALTVVERTLRTGIRTLKVKLGRDFDRELDTSARIRAAFPEVRLRFDVNRAWTPPRAEHYLSRLIDLAPEFVEEPTRPPFPTSAVPLALDETLGEIPAPSPNTYPPIELSNVSHVVLKPARLGVWGALRWATTAREQGIEAVVSHLFDGPIALASAIHLAFAIQAPGVAAGLGRHRGLDAWGELDALVLPEFVGTATLERPRPPGLGFAQDGLKSLSMRTVMA